MSVNKFAAMMAAKRQGQATPSEATETKAPPVASAPANRFAAKLGKPTVTVAAPKPEVDEELTLDSLLDSEDEGIESSDPDFEVREVLSQFDDETPATKPTRDVPEDADKGLRQFVELIDGVYGVVHDPELLGNVIRGIMIELKSNPQYMQQVADDDIRVWVRAMRSTMGLARIRKTEAKSKRGTGAAKKSKGVDADMEAAFDELGINFDDL